MRAADEVAEMPGAMIVPGGVYMPGNGRPAERFVWDVSLPGSQAEVLGPAGRWWKLDWRKGDRVATLKLGLMTAHEARATPGIRGEGWYCLSAMGLCLVASLDF